MSKKLSANQKVFNVVYRHLMKQNKKSGSGIFCRYRTKCGLRCAIGALIPNRLYHKDIEGSPVYDLLCINTDIRYHIKKRFGDCNMSLLDGLQKVHDEFEVDEWNEQLKFIAGEYKLTIPKTTKTANDKT